MRCYKVHHYLPPLRIVRRLDYRQIWDPPTRSAGNASGSASRPPTPLSAVPPPSSSVLPNSGGSQQINCHSRYPRKHCRAFYKKLSPHSLPYPPGQSPDAFAAWRNTMASPDAAAHSHNNNIRCPPPQSAPVTDPACPARIPAAHCPLARQRVTMALVVIKRLSFPVKLPSCPCPRVRRLHPIPRTDALPWDSNPRSSAMPSSSRFDDVRMDRRRGTSL